MLTFGKDIESFRPLFPLDHIVLLFQDSTGWPSAMPGWVSTVYHPRSRIYSIGAGHRGMDVKLPSQRSRERRHLHQGVHPEEVRFLSARPIFVPIFWCFMQFRRYYGLYNNIAARESQPSLHNHLCGAVAFLVNFTLILLKVFC